VARDSRFAWVGGETCLDFNNTVAWGSHALEEERLRSTGDLLEWGKDAKLIPSPPGRSSVPPRALEDALSLRATLHRTFSPLSRWHAPDPETLGTLNRFLSRSLAGARLSRGKGIFLWDFSGSARELDPILAAVTWSAARLLTSPDLGLLRECANPECGWLFVDRSRRRNRRWCEMRECGNRAKARRYYRRHRTSARGEESPRALLGRSLGRESPL
jgi:predicted RNA-binding Zn ribbon-like protein